jgi:hypothetical protein
VPKLTPDASKSAKKERMKTEMEKFKRGTLHSGSKIGPTVTSRDQALAISLSESGQSKNSRVITGSELKKREVKRRTGSRNKAYRRGGRR